MLNEYRSDPLPLVSHVVWLPPPPDSIKINVDAKFVADYGSASVGVVDKNSVGEVLLSSWDIIPTCPSVEGAELCACLTSL